MKILRKKITFRLYTTIEELKNQREGNNWKNIRRTYKETDLIQKWQHLRLKIGHKDPGWKTMNSLFGMSCFKILSILSGKHGSFKNKSQTVYRARKQMKVLLPLISFSRRRAYFWTSFPLSNLQWSESVKRF